MPEIYNNSENTANIEQNPQIQVEQGIYTPENQIANTSETIIQSTEQVAPTTEQYKAENHIKQLVETQKNIYQSAPITKPLSPKIQEKYGWLLNVSGEHRVEVSVKMITTKGKDILDVINAFLAIEDYTNLDSLEESLSAIYPTLISEGILSDINNK